MVGCIARLAALVIGVALALVVAEAVLRRAPALIPLPVFQSLPGGGRYLQPLVFDQPVELGFRYLPYQSVTFSFSPDDPTILGERQAAQVALRDGARTLRLRFQTDADGFLNRPDGQSSHAVVITGDSFLGLSAEEHWQDWLTKYTGSRALNLAIPGWGPQAEAAALRRFGLGEQPKELVLAFFEGNDLWDAWQYELHRVSGQSWIAHDLEGTTTIDQVVLPKLLRWYADQFDRRWRGDGGKVYRYPLNARISGLNLALVFADQHVARLTTPRADIEAAVNFKLTAAALREARDLAQAGGARFTLAFLPSKERVHLPLLRQSPELVERALAGVFTVAIGPDGTLDATATPADAETLFAHIDDQANAMADFARREDIAFLDLTPAFREAAARGEPMFNYADTHWNAEGHKLAAKVLGEYLSGKAGP